MQFIEKHRAKTPLFKTVIQPDTRRWRYKDGEAGKLEKTFTGKQG